MKDNEFYRPAGRGTGTEEPSAVRDEFARPEAASVRPKERRRQHGRLLRLLCGAAAVTVIAQTALPAEAVIPVEAVAPPKTPLPVEEVTLPGKPEAGVSMPAPEPANKPASVPTSDLEAGERVVGSGLNFPNLLRWEEITLAGLPFDQVTPEDLERFYQDATEFIQELGVEETQQTERSYYSDTVQFHLILNDMGAEGWWRRYFVCEKDDGSGPDPEFRGLAMGMNVDEAIRRIGISEEEWSLLREGNENNLWGNNNREGLEESGEVLWGIATHGVDRYADKFILYIDYNYGMSGKMVTLNFKNGRLVSIGLSSSNY